MGDPELIRVRVQSLIAAAILAPGIASAQDTPVSWDDQVRPLLNEWCGGCHRGSRAKNGLQLTSLDAILEGGSSGAAIIPGDPDGSLLFQAVSHLREPYMPPDEERMPDEQLAMLRAWIAGLAPAAAAPVSAPAAVLPAATTATAVMPEGLRRDPYWWSATPTASNAIACAPLAPLVAVAGHRQVMLHHLETLERLGVLEFPEGSIHDLVFSRDGTILLAGGGRGAESGRVVGWRVADGTRLFEIGAEPDVVLAADLTNDHHLVALGGPDRIARVFDVASGAPLYEVTKHTDWITALAFSPDGVLLATGDRVGNVAVWEADTGREFHTLPAHGGRVTGLAWRGDATVLASAGEDGVVRLHEMEHGRQVKTWSSHGSVLGLDFTPGGQIATCGRDRHARLWDGNGGQLGQYGPLDDLACAVAAGHDGTRVVASGWTGEVRVYAADGTMLGTLATSPPTIAQDEASRAHAAIAPLEQTLAARRERVGVADTDLAARQETFVAAETTLSRADDDLAGAQTAADEARSPVTAAAAEADRLRVSVRDAQARADGIRASVEAARAEATAAETAMQAAVREALAAGTDEQRAMADKLLEGATAVAQLAASKRASLEIELSRASVEQEHWTARATPVIERAATLAAQLQAAETVVAAKEKVVADARGQVESLRSVTGRALAEAEAARVTLGEAEGELAAARKHAEAAAAARAAQRTAIEAGGGRVP